VNGHVTFVAPRVAGQVSKVFVDDNERVKKGDLLVQLDKEPYQVQVAIKKSAVASAESDLAAANAQVHGMVAAIRANRFTLQHAIENVNTEIANLHAAVATLNSARARLDLARANLSRGEALTPTGAMSKVRAIRVGLGLPPEPPEGKDLADVPPGLDQSFSTVNQSLAALAQSAAQLGFFPTRWENTPAEAIEDFYKQDPAHNFDRIVTRIMADAPAIKQAQARLLQTRRDLDQAELNLRYCDVFSEIDGLVTRRNINPGNNVQAGQSLMAIRSLNEIWIDANFKETQLADLRIGQRVVCEVDMYGAKKEFEGRITGFTMGTGQTLALLPPQNATGNFVKIVQRLPVRIELTDYEPKKAPLFVGLSVEPRVYYKEKPTGPHAGEVLQPIADGSATTKEVKP
jgi:membrane fusion protein, multidrug efflux system